MVPPLDGLDAAFALRAVSTVALAWLAWSFGRTLRAGHTPLIEQIARVGMPSPPPTLCRYCRRLTAIWCAWLACAAILPWLLAVPGGLAGLLAALGSAVLFVGERILRPCLFPALRFPGLAQQARDTRKAWQRARQTGR